MLGVRHYPQTYIDACRARINRDVAAFDALTAASAIETPFFNNLVIVLDHLFVHRLRTVEGKDGNPINEVRMLVDSMMENDDTLRADSTIKYNPAKSVLGLQIGDAICLTRADFERLRDAYLAEIERKFAAETEPAAG